MEEEIKIYGGLPSLIEVPADVLLYWALKATGLKGIVTDLELQKYRNAVCRAYNELKQDIKEILAFNFPYGNNYQHEIFEEVILSDRKTGFRLKKVKTKKAKELLEYRLVKLEAFTRMQKLAIREMFALADHYYSMEQPVTYTQQKRSSLKEKILKLARRVKEK